MAIKCCYGCVAPKRHLGCHDTCEEYQGELARHIAEKQSTYMSVSGAYEIDNKRKTKDSRAKHRKRRGAIY